MNVKPIAITQQHAEDGASYFATFLSRAGLPYRLFRLDQGETPPQDILAFSGFCLLGGPMSANDDLPTIEPQLKLVRDAIAADIPVIGHCLGGQLMAKALGGTVQTAEHAEIGWAEMAVDPAGRHWFGGRDQVRLFQWHGESFSIPREATQVVRGRYCANQAFQLGKHLAMQFHCEVDSDKIRAWLVLDHQDLQRNAHSPAVQSAGSLLATLEEDVANSQRVAEDIYAEWIKGLKG
jgi:GMP synthase-like glutamine amidotransferase